MTYIFECEGKKCCDRCKVLKTSFSQVYPTDCLYGKGREFCSWSLKELKDGSEVVSEKETATLPDWIKVGSWAWAERTGYFRIEEIEGGSCICGRSANGDGQTVLGEPVSEARLRPWTCEEAPETVKVKLKDSEVFDVLYLKGSDDIQDEANFESKRYDLTITGKDLIDPDYDYCRLDGSPCGVLEHKNKQGEWVR